MKQKLSARGQPRGDVKRQLLIDTGTAIFTQRGFSGTGLDEIVQQAQVPKGSFYYYFDSKEEFVQEVIRNYAAYFAKKLDRTLGDLTLTPLERLRAFVVEATHGVSRFGFKRGCLVGNLGQELATLQDQFRLPLLGVLNQWRDRFRDCIQAAQHCGEIETTVEPAALARFFWSAWEGAVLCAKLEQSTQPLDNVGQIFFDEMLRPVRTVNASRRPGRPAQQ